MCIINSYVTALQTREERSKCRKKHVSKYKNRPAWILEWGRRNDQHELSLTEGCQLLNTTCNTCVTSTRMKLPVSISRGWVRTGKRVENKKWFKTSLTELLQFQELFLHRYIFSTTITSGLIMILIWLILVILTINSWLYMRCVSFLQTKILSVILAWYPPKKEVRKLLTNGTNKLHCYDHKT